MAKKFKDPIPDSPPVTADLRVSLADYLRAHAPDALLPLAVMEGASALRFWEQTFQPPQAGEGKRLFQGSLRWPYAERLAYLAREFTKLDDRCRRYVLKAAQAQIWWRGDDIPRFRSIVAANLAYRRLSEAERAEYRKRLMSAAKAGVGRVQTHSSSAGR